MNDPSVASLDFVTDGTTMAWLESSAPDSDGFFATSTLKVSSFATSPALVDAHALGSSECKFYDCASTISNGYMISQGVTSGTDSAQAVIATHLSDGVVSRIAPIINSAVHERLGAPAFVRQGDVWLSVGDRPNLGLTITKQSLAALSSDGGG